MGKITAQTAASSVLATDLVPVVSDPGGTPLSRKATLQKLIDLFLGGKTPSAVAQSVTDTVAATNADTVSTIMKRDSNGDFTSRIHLSDAASTIVPFQVTNASDTRAHFGQVGQNTRGMSFFTDGSTGIRSAGTNYLQIGNGTAQFNFTMLQQLSKDGNVNMQGQGWNYANSTTQTGNTANTTTSLFSQTLSNGNMGVNKQGYRFVAAGTFATADVDKRLTAIIGSTTIFDTTGKAFAAGSAWCLEGWFMRTGAATGKCMVKFTCNDQTLGLPLVTFTSLAETWASDLTFAIQGKSTSASGVIGEMFQLWFNPQ